jgi:hypothetical protein
MEYNDKYNLAVNLIQKGYLIHCTNEQFTHFDAKHIKGGGRAKEGYGFYFSDMPYKPIGYGENFKVIKKSDFNFFAKIPQKSAKKRSRPKSAPL